MDSTIKCYAYGLRWSHQPDQGTGNTKPKRSHCNKQHIFPLITCVVANIIYQVLLHCKGYSCSEQPDLLDATFSTKRYINIVMKSADLSQIRVSTYVHLLKQIISQRPGVTHCVQVCVLVRYYQTSTHFHTHTRTHARTHARTHTHKFPLTSSCLPLLS